mgnify:CR=1 FL=1
MAEGTGLPRLELEGAGIRLRPYRESDAVPLYAAARESVAEVFPWIDWCHPGYTLEEASQWVSGQPEKWDIGTAFEFVITGAVSGAFLGGCPPRGHAAGPAQAGGYGARCRDVLTAAGRSYPGG